MSLFYVLCGAGKPKRTSGIPSNTLAGPGRPAAKKLVTDWVGAADQAKRVN
jgi:hypothetical protein